MRFILCLRPSPALVVACLALLVALAGTGVAAVTLVPRNSVGSDQVIDGSLRARDFRAGEVLGGSGVFTRSVAGPVSQAGDRLTSVASLDIPKPGAYVIWASATFDNAKVVGGHCLLFAQGIPNGAGGVPDVQQAESYVEPSVADDDTVTLAPAVVHGFASIGGSAELQCGGLSKKTPAAFRNITITAVRLSGGS